MSPRRAKYRGFDLKSVTWGYRDIFKSIIDQLYAEGMLGEENEESTTLFFDLLKRSSDNPSFDHVLKNFLESLNSDQHWIMRIPWLFSDWIALGGEFASHKAYMGLKYFEVWGKSGFGETPADVRYTINKARQLLTIDPELAYFFVVSYHRLAKRLSNEDIDVFIEHALTLRARAPQNAYTFLQLKTKTANAYVRMISREARLSDVAERLRTLARAIAGEDMDVENFSQLDSDDLIERGSGVVAASKWLYLPAKTSHFPTAERNRTFYMLVTAIAASASNFDGFAASHGFEGARTSLDFLTARGFPEVVFLNNAATAFDCHRVIRRMIASFSGLRQPLRKLLVETRKGLRLRRPADRVLLKSLETLVKKRVSMEPEIRRVVKLMMEVAAESNSFLETAARVAERIADAETAVMLKPWFSDETTPLPFFPDPMFPMTISTPSDSAMGGDLKDQDQGGERDQKSGDDRDEEEKKKGADVTDATASDQRPEGKGDDAGAPVGYFYDEWNELEKEYFENWCRVREMRVEEPVESVALGPECQRLSRMIKRVFEKLKPDLVRKEKRLPHGDDINIDQLIDFIAQRKARIMPRERFYEKPFVKKRDLSVAILIDMSGSTGEKVNDRESVIELEKEASFILGEGLAELGDPFGVFGFTGNGRENAEFFVFKEFEQDWDEAAQRALFSAHARSSTRMGAAVRHVGYKLSKVSTRKKIVILITDGKPMDSNYDPNNRYAQFDVRRANEENARKGIDSFCISTEENKIEDLEIMFPQHRFIIIKNMRELPKLLSQFYLRITK